MTASGHTAPAVVVGVTAATTILAGLAVVMRLVTRVTVVKRFGADDICITIAMALSVALTITMCQQVEYGMGRHYSTLTNSDKLHLMQWFWASVWIYYTALCFTKVSILLQYLRVFPSTGFRKACFTLMGIVIAYSLATFLTSVFACVPVASFWDPTIKGSCVNLKAVWFTNASINIVTDVCTGVLPIPTLNSLNLPRRQKYALMAVFALGGFTCIISILRLQSLYVVSISLDITWDNPLPAIWSSTETNVGIICSCLPTLKGCITHFFPRLFPSANSGNISGRDTRATGRSQPEWQRTSTAGTAVELAEKSKRMSKGQFQFWESEQSVAQSESHHSNGEIQHDFRTSGQTWLQDASSKEDIPSRESDITGQHSKAMSSYQVV